LKIVDRVDREPSAPLARPYRRAMARRREAPGVRERAPQCGRKREVLRETNVWHTQARHRMMRA
jgi:hypothetical protein